jgi:hypothetical protein
LGVLFGSDEKSVKLYISDGCTTLNSAPKYWIHYILKPTKLYTFKVLIYWCINADVHLKVSVFPWGAYYALKIVALKHMCKSWNSVCLMETSKYISS